MLLMSLRQPASPYPLSEKLEKQCEEDEPVLPVGQFWLLMSLYEWKNIKSRPGILLVCLFLPAGICLKLLSTQLSDAFSFHPVSSHLWIKDLKSVADRNGLFYTTAPFRSPTFCLLSCPALLVVKLLMALKWPPSWARVTQHSAAPHFSLSIPHRHTSHGSLGNFDSPPCFPSWGKMILKAFSIVNDTTAFW